MKRKSAAERTLPLFPGFKPGTVEEGREHVHEIRKLEKRLARVALEWLEETATAEDVLSAANRLHEAKEKCP